MAEELRIALIGAGRIGQLHGLNLSTRIPQAKLVLVVDALEESAQRCAALVGGCQVSTNYRDALERSDVDAIVVCSPTDTHAPIIEAAAAAGKHVFCEKPIAVDLAAIDRALAAVERAGTLLQIGFNRRFDANFRRVHDAIQQGEIGEPHLLHIISRDPAPPPIDYVRVSGGLFLDMAIHDFDMARFLIGREVEEIYASGAVRIDPKIGEAGDIDTALTVLKFAGGLIGTIDNSRQAVYGYDQRVEVLGSEGSISVDNNYPNTATIAGKNAVHRDLPLNFFMERYEVSYLEEISQFVTAVLTGGQSPVSGADGRMPVVMAMAAAKSLAENRPVNVAEIG